MIIECNNMPSGNAMISAIVAVASGYGCVGSVIRDTAVVYPYCYCCIFYTIPEAGTAVQSGVGRGCGTRWYQTPRKSGNVPGTKPRIVHATTAKATSGYTCPRVWSHAHSECRGRDKP